MAEEKKHRVFIIDCEAFERPTICYVASDWEADDLRSRGPADTIVDMIASELDEMADGDTATITFKRKDMTKGEIDAIPEC